MLNIPKINNYLKVLTNEEVKNFVAISYSAYFKPIKEEQNLQKVAKLFCIFLTTMAEVEKNEQSNSSDSCIHRYNVEILNLFDPELQLVNTKPIIKYKLKELLNGLKKFKVLTILVLDYKKRNNRKIFHSSTKVITSDLYINEAFEYMYQSIMTKIKNYTFEDWIVLDVIIKHSIKIFGW